MNVRNQLIEIQCNHREVDDVLQALIHSLIFFRTHGKFNYKHEESYSIGTLGFERANCSQINFSYIRCSSHSLINKVNGKIQEFVDKLNENTHYGNISLEFYTRRPSRWPFNDSRMVWELWNIKIVINWNYSHQNSSKTIGDQHRQTTSPNQSSSMRIEDILSHKLLDIIKIVNNEKCSLPQMPTQPHLDTVFDTSHSDLQPYLYSISYRITENLPNQNGSYRVSNAKFADGNVVTDSTTQSTLKKFLLGTLEL